MAALTKFVSLLLLGLIPQVAGCASPARAAAQTSTTGPDPALSDGDKYAVMYENALIRVLHYHDAPGEKTHQHRHPNFFLYALNPFERRITFPDGSFKDKAFKAGDFAWMPSQLHTGENTGKTPSDALLFELKQDLAALNKAK
jgi:beta-alanine degradation protein BauB